MSLYGLALCSGYAGLEIGIRRAGLPVRFVCHVEREAYAAANLARLMESRELDRAPIWSDLRTFDALEWREHISLVTAGFPCQPFSAAGSRTHLEDPRWIWGSIARILRDVSPAIVFLENVPGLAVRGLAPVLATLATLGFDAEWGTVRAEDAGAPHRRTRLFVLAIDPHEGRAHVRKFLADTGRTGEGADQRGGGEVSGGGAPDARPARAYVANPELHGPQGERPTWPPGPSDEEGWIEYIRSGGPKPGIRRGDYGTPDRVDRLRLLGNGVVPDQAALAFRTLAERIL